MVNDIKNSESPTFLNNIRSLIIKYKQKTTCGIVFKIYEKEYPLELIKVLNLIKDKIQRWANSNIFTYTGILFKKNKVVIIGAESQIHAVDLVILVYLTEIIKLNQKVEGLLGLDNFEQSLRDEISNSIVKGYPYDDEIESKIKNHILMILAEISDADSAT